MLQQDEFSRVAAALSAPSQIIVFDSEGNRLYSSSAEIAEEISPDDLDLIASGNDWFYEVLLRTDESGSTWCEVSLCKNSDDGKSKAVLGNCLCDDDGTIVSGSLFPGRKRLSPRDLSLLQGNYGTDMLIDKYEYSNSRGQARTLVLVSPSYNKTSVNELADRARSLWLAAVPFAIAATIVAAYCISRVIQNGVRPLDNAIAARLRSGDVRTDSDKIPNELRPTFGHFVEIMDELDEERRDKQRIIADVSHDLRTPLTVILGYATALLDGKVAKDEE